MDDADVYVFGGRVSAVFGDANAFIEEMKVIILFNKVHLNARVYRNCNNARTVFTPSMTFHSIRFQVKFLEMTVKLIAGMLFLEVL